MLANAQLYKDIPDHAMLAASPELRAHRNIHFDMDEIYKDDYMIPYMSTADLVVYLYENHHPVDFNKCPASLRLEIIDVVMLRKLDINIKSIKMTPQEACYVIRRKPVCFEALKFVHENFRPLSTGDLEFLYPSDLAPELYTLLTDLKHRKLAIPWYNCRSVDIDIRYSFTTQKNIKVHLNVVKVFKNPNIVCGNRITEIHSSYRDNGEVADLMNFIWNSYDEFKRIRKFVAENLQSPIKEEFLETSRSYEVLFRRARTSKKNLLKCIKSNYLVHEDCFDKADLSERQKLVYMRRFQTAKISFYIVAPALEFRRVYRYLYGADEYKHRLRFNIPENILLVWQIIKNKIGMHGIIKICRKYPTSGVFSISFLICSGNYRFITREIFEFCQENSYTLKNLALFADPDTYMLIHSQENPGDD